MTIFCGRPKKTLFAITTRTVLVREICMLLGCLTMAFPCRQRMIGGDAVTELDMRMIDARFLIIRSKLCPRIVMRSKTGVATQGLTYREL